MHAENYGDVQQAADAVDYNVDALDFWATETPSGLRTLRHTVQLPRTSACLYRIRSLTLTPASLCRAFGILRFGFGMCSLRFGPPFNGPRDRQPIAYR